jgi:hypothetical protein
MTEVSTMITYKNISYSAKTFYGVTFEPGETKSVPGYINKQGMVRVFGVKPITNKTVVYDAPTQTNSRGRKKKSNDSEKDSVAENTEIKLDTQEETTDGNPS